MSGRPPNPNSYQGNHSGGQRYPGQRQQEPTHPWERHQSRGQNWQGWNQSYGPDGGYQGYGPGGPQGPYPQYGPPGQNQAPGIMGQRPPDALPQHSGWNQSYRPDGQYQGYGPGGPQGPYPQCGPPGQNQAPGIMSQGPPDALPQHAGWNQAYRPDGQNQGYGPGGPQGSYTQYGPPGQNQATGNMVQGPPAPQFRTYSNSPVIALNNMNKDVVYSFLNETSPFQVLVCFGGQEVKGVATTKKAAKEEAAKQAMTQYYDMHYVPGQDKKEIKAKANKQERQEEKKDNISIKENQGKKKENTRKTVSKEERKTSESAEESNQKTVDNLLSALSQLAGAKSEIPELGGLIADIRKGESEPKKASGYKKTRSGKRTKKGGTKGGNNDDDDENGDDTDLISGETEREGSARGERVNDRGKGRGSRGRECGQGRGRMSRHRSGDQGQNEDDDEDDSEEDDDSDTGSVHSAVYQRSMGSGLNIALPNKRDRQFSSTDNISDARRGRGRRGHRGQGQGRGRGGHGNMNRNRAVIESCHDEVDDLGLDDNEVFEFVVKECGGMVKLSNLVVKCQLFPSGSDEARIGQWFKTHRRRFHVFQDGQEVVFIAPFFKDATYCLDYTRKQCNRENCDHFHICQHYLRGTCHKGDTCPKSHSFTDDHNLEHKIKLGLNGFSEIDICIILLNRYPQICRKNYCKEDKRCPYLHICQKFISKNCMYGQKCKKGHSFDTEHNAWIINRIYRMEKWDKSEGSRFRNIISFPRSLRKGSRHDSGSSKQDDMDSLAETLSDMSLESDSDSDSDDEPVKPDLFPRTISRRDRFKSTEQLHDTEYLRAVEVNIDDETTSEGQGKKSRKKKNKKTEPRGSDMSEEEVFDASAKNRNRKDSDKSEEGGIRRKDTNGREQETAIIHLDEADKTSICYNNVADRSQNPIDQSPVTIQLYSQDNFQLNGSPLDYQNVGYSRSAADGADGAHPPTQTYRTASGREVPILSNRQKEDEFVLL